MCCSCASLFGSNHNISESEHYYLGLQWSQSVPDHEKQRLLSHLVTVSLQTFSTAMSSKTCGSFSRSLCHLLLRWHFMTFFIITVFFALFALATLLALLAAPAWIRALRGRVIRHCCHSPCTPISGFWKVCSSIRISEENVCGQKGCILWKHLQAMLSFIHFARLWSNRNPSGSICWQINPMALLKSSGIQPKHFATFAEVSEVYHYIHSSVIRLGLKRRPDCWWMVFRI